MDQLKHKFKGSSIVETITALLIIVISFGAGMSIYLNVLTNEKTIAKTKANIVMHNIANKAIAEHVYIDEEIHLDGLLFEKKILPYADDQYHRILQISAYDKTTLIHQTNQIIYLEE